MNTKIRFVVYNAYGIGGTVKTIFNFANYFYGTGKYDVEVISIKRTKDKPTLPINPGVKLTVVYDARKNIKYTEEEYRLLNEPSELIDPEEDLYVMFSKYVDIKLMEILNSLHDGILVTTMPSLNVIAAKYVDKNVLTIGQEHKSYADHTPGIQKLIRENYGQLDALTILTERNKKVYQRKIKEDIPIYVLGNGTERLKYRSNLKNHVLVAAGRYADQKGYDMLIKSFGKIAKDFPDWKLKIYGEGSLAPEYIKLIQEYNIESQVVLEPGSDKMNEKLSEASIHVCSSYFEPFGMVIIEGFALGVPCVSFACDGPVEIIKDGYDGIVVPKEDIDALADAMKKVMADEEYRQMLGKNAYETAKKYDISTIGHNLQIIVEKEMDSLILRQKNAVIANESMDENVVALEEEVCEKTYIDYEQYIRETASGRVGLKVILIMLKSWFAFKVKNK